jgi:hypothetical protein
MVPPYLRNQNRKENDMKHYLIAVMSMVLMLCVGAAMVMPTNAHAGTIYVAGQEITVPSNYRLEYIEKRANRCVARMLSKVDTDTGAKMLPLVCTQMVINGDNSWER